METSLKRVKLVRKYKNSLASIMSKRNGQRRMETRKRTKRRRIKKRKIKKRRKT